MKNEPIDPQKERLIAYLYGEMTEEETRTFARALEKDDALRQDFEELRGAREVLAGWNVPEPPPSFVFLREAPSRPSAETKWWKRFSFFRGAGGFGLGLATAVAAGLIVSATGFRMEKVDGGFAFRFGEKETALPVAEQLTTPVRSVPLELANHAQPARTSGAESGEYVTRAEFEKLSEQMVGSVVDLLNEYGNQQNQEVSGVLHSMYAQLSDRQSRDSEEIRHRMSALGVELLLRQAKAGSSSGELRMQPASIEERDIVSPWKTLEWKEEWR